MDLNRIEKGDIVRVWFQRLAAIPKAEVLYVPQATGDSWHVRELDTGELRYVQHFQTMDLVEKKAK